MSDLEETKVTTATIPKLTSSKLDMDDSPDAFGELRSSASVVNEPDELRRRMGEDGYLFLPGCLSRDEVMAARAEITDRLAREGLLDPAYPAIESVVRAGVNLSFKPDLAENNAPLYQLLYGGAMMRIYERLLGGAVRHFDFTWMRAVAPGHATQPHCDIVYMGRGTTNLYTSWTPLGDVPLRMGGLMILEGSHRHERLRNGYGRKDVDTYCVTRRDGPSPHLGGGGTIAAGGVLSPNPVKLRERLGGRWITADYAAGDLLIFSMYTVHASLDNHTDRIRLSSDTRYQLASDPVDERWIGERPIAHGAAAKRSFIC